MWTKRTSISGHYEQKDLEAPFSSYFTYQIKRRQGTSVPREKRRKFHVIISYGELESFGDFVTVFVQSNFEPDMSQVVYSQACSRGC